MRERGRVAFHLAMLCSIVACGTASDSPAVEAPDVIAVPSDVTIGLLEGDSAYLFGAIVSVAADTAGRIYVGDRIGASIRVYGGDGQYLQQIAREGRGPGEIYGWPADITIGNAGELFVRDASRITVFVPTRAGGVADSVAATWSIGGYGNLSSTRSRVGITGDYYYPGYLFMDGRLPRFFYLPFGPDGPGDDTLEVPAYPGLSGLRRASYRISAGSGRMLEGLSHVPFAALPVWDVTRAGTILSADGSRYEIIETGPGGDTIRVIAGPTATIEVVPPAERADSARALDARLDTLPVPLDDVMNLGEGVRERRLPETLPSMLGIHVATDGRIWIERWPAEGRSGSRFYDVLDPDGRLLQQLELQAPLTRDPPPFFGARYVVGVLRDGETGVERVVRFTIRGTATPVAPGGS